MGATEEQLALLNYLSIDSASYSNVLLSFGFVVFLFAFTLIYLWEHLTNFSGTGSNKQGYTEVERVPILDASSAFLEDDDDDDDTRHSDEPSAIELKPANRYRGSGSSEFV